MTDSSYTACLTILLIGMDSYIKRIASVHLYAVVSHNRSGIFS